MTSLVPSTGIETRVNRRIDNPPSLGLSRSSGPLVLDHGLAYAWVSIFLIGCGGKLLRAHLFQATGNAHDVDACTHASL